MSNYRILCAWIGNNDLKAARELQGLGPIVSALTEAKFEKVVLLSTYPNPMSYVEWLTEQVGDIEIQISHCPLSSPTNHKEIYQAAKAVVEGVKLLHPQAELVFHTSPGTPAMSAMWIRLRDLAYPEAQLIQTSIQRGLEIIDLPAIETHCEREIKLWLGTGLILGIYCETKISY